MEDDFGTSLKNWVSRSGDRGRRSASGTGQECSDPSIPLLKAAERTWRGMVEYAARHLGDEARAEEVVDEVLRSACNACRRNPIREPESYLFSGVVRRVKKLLARSPRIEYVGSVEDLDALRETQDTNWVTEVENQLLIEELAGFVDKETWKLLLKRVMRDSWDEIGRDLGISANAAQQRFRYGIRQARERLAQSNRLQEKPMPAATKKN